MNSDLDHLVIAAHTLDQGAAWCEAALGVAPLAGGRHPQFGTHNRLLAIGSPAFPQAYLEIIAIDPDAPPPGRARWFGLDDPALQARLRDEGPCLHHVVLRTPNLEMLRWGLITLGVQPGEPVAAERQATAGLLRWRILVRPDGAVALDGRMPTLIQWDGPHPADTMPASPVTLRSATLGGLPPRVQDLLRLRGPKAAADGPALRAELDTPRGPVTLSSP